MAIQWSTPTAVNFSASPQPPVKVTATRQRPGGGFVSISFQVSFDINEEPFPTESDVLNWLSPLYSALVVDGWTNVLFSQQGVSTRNLEDV